jgi:hypothetical protein
VSSRAAPRLVSRGRGDRRHSRSALSPRRHAFRPRVYGYCEIRRDHGRRSATDDGTVDLELSVEELVVLNDALNEGCNDIEIDDCEFTGPNFACAPRPPIG